MTEITRRALLAGVSAPALLAQVGQIPWIVQPSPPTGATRLATLTLQNTSGSTQAAGGVTPPFGWCFKMGDVPSGTAPQFLVNTVPQPYSWGCQTYWPDGSLCWAMFMLRTTTPIAGNGSLAVGVYNGGAAPAASARSITEVYALGLTVSGASAGANFGLAAGTWAASLASGAFNHGAYVYMDGQAGKVWRVETDFTQSGVAHGQLYCYHYIAALQDSGGNLGGFRHVAKITQPWYNNDSPAKNWRTFSLPITVAWTGGGGGSFNVPWPFSAVNFTGASGQPYYSCWVGATTPNWYVGAGYFHTPDLNVVPGTISGTLDSTLSATRIYWAAFGPSETPYGGGKAFQIWSQPNGSTITAAGNGGTMTFTPLPNILHFGTIFTLNPAAKWTFMQGAGSMSADATLRTQFDINYFHATGMLGAPISLAQTPSDTNATWLSLYPNWSPISSGPVHQDVGATGDDPSIGMLMNWEVVHFFNQSAAGEQVVRSAAYSGCFEPTSFRDWNGTSGNRNLPALNGNSYTGMTANTQLAWQASNGQQSGAASGFNPPPNNNFMFAESNTSHKPPFNYYAALVFGGPDLLDLLAETANQGVLNAFGAPISRNWTTPYTVNGLVVAAPQNSGVRAAAWGMRDLFYAASLVPANYPDGSQLGRYFTDMATAQPAYVAAITNATYLNSYATALNMHAVITNFGPPPEYENDSGINFANSYWDCVMAYGACARLRDVNAKTNTQNRAGYLTHMGVIFNPYHLYIEDNHIVGPPRYSAGNAGTLINQDAHWGITLNGFAALTWTPSGGFFGSPPNLLFGWVPATGDKWIFDDTVTTPCPTNFSADRPYFARDIASLGGSNYSWNLAKAPLGQPDWAASTSYPSNSFVQPTSGNAGNFVYCQINPLGGTSGGSAPTWPQTEGNIVNDNGLTWQCFGTSAAIAPNASGSMSGGSELGNTAGPWVVIANPPKPSAGFGPTSNGYVVWSDAAFATMQATAAFLGFSLPAGLVSTLYADSQARIRAGNMYPGQWGQWNCQTTF